jgi:hypothetical protein
MIFFRGVDPNVFGNSCSRTDSAQRLLHPQTILSEVLFAFDCNSLRLQLSDDQMARKMSEPYNLSNVSWAGRERYKTSTDFPSGLSKSTISTPPLSYIVDMQSFTVLFALLTTAAVAFAADAHWSPPSSGSHYGSTGSNNHYGSSGVGVGAGAGAGAGSPCDDPSAGGLGNILDPTLCGVTGTVNNLCTLAFEDLFTHC